MGIFDPIWKTEDERKEQKAAAFVKHIRSTEKLNEIFLSAPRNRVKIAALARLQRITNGQYQTDERSKMRALLSAAPLPRISGDSAFDWYVGQLLTGLSAERLTEVVLKAENSSVRKSALSKISDEEHLIQIGNHPSLQEGLREEVVRKLYCWGGRTLQGIADDASLSRELRSAADQMLKRQKEQAERMERQRQAVAEKRAACAQAGHKWKFIELKYTSSGREAYYQCETCGERWMNFIEGSTDSV